MRYLNAVDVYASMGFISDVVNLRIPLRRMLARNLRTLRKNQGLSQEALADLAGLHRTFVGSVERSERNISLDNIGRLADALSVSAAELLAEASE